jgi:hypothetical protein
MVCQLYALYICYFMDNNGMDMLPRKCIGLVFHCSCKNSNTNAFFTFASKLTFASAKKTEYQNSIFRMSNDNKKNSFFKGTVQRDRSGRN